MTAESAEQKKWLIKSSGRILGPLSTEQVESLLLDREIVLLDEVMAPLGRWTYIREELHFAAAVEKIRDKLSTLSEETEAGSVSSTLKVEKTITVTESDAFGDVTPSPAARHPSTALARDGVSGPAREVEQEMFREIHVEAEDEAKLTVESPDDFKNGRAKKTGSALVEEPLSLSSSLSPSLSPSLSLSKEDRSGSKSTKIKQKNAGPGKYSVWFFVVAAAAIFVWLARPQLGHHTSSYSDLFDKAIKAQAIGDDIVALDFFHQAQRLRADDPELMIAMSSLSLKIEKKPQEVRKRLLDIMPHLHREDQLKQIRMILGNAALMEEDSVEALGYFDSVLKLDPLNLAATFDYGVAQFNLRQQELARSSFEKLLSYDPRYAPATVMLARTLTLSATAGGKDNRLLIAADDLLATFVDQAADFRQEGLLLRAMISWLIGKREKTVEYIQKVVEADPDLTAEHYHDALLNLSQLSWTSLGYVCNELYGALGRTPNTLALRSLCLFKQGQKQEALDLVNESLAKYSEDERLSGIKSYILSQVGPPEAALQYLRESTGAAASPLAALVNLRICRHSNYVNCSVAHTQLLEQAMPYNPAYQVYKVEQKAELSAAARNNLLAQIQPAVSKYIPFLKLRAKWRSE